MKKILVTGANGQLGKCLQNAAKALPKEEYEFIFADRKALDVGHADSVQSYFFSNKVDYVINCAAYTAVDKAEEEVEKAFIINADAVGLLAQECAEQNAQFIHISTDYVFDGKANSPYKETDTTNPLGVYGKSKLEGERLALENNPNSIIVRTAWVYSEFGHNFLKTMLRLFKEKEEISIVDDQIGTPTNANDIAETLLEIIRNKTKTPGIYHFTNAGKTTWFGFAEAIKDFTHSAIKINPIPTSAYPTPAKRPMYSVLDKTKIVETYGVKVKDWRESLEGVITKN